MQDVLSLSRSPLSNAHRKMVMPATENCHSNVYKVEPDFPSTWIHANAENRIKKICTREIFYIYDYIIAVPSHTYIYSNKTIELTMLLDVDSVGWSSETLYQHFWQWVQSEFIQSKYCISLLIYNMLLQFVFLHINNTLSKVIIFTQQF